MANKYAYTWKTPEEMGLQTYGLVNGLLVHCKWFRSLFPDDWRAMDEFVARDDKYYADFRARQRAAAVKERQAA